jgi:hypothetical protein
LKKLRRALELAGRDSVLPERDEPFESVALSFDLRNALVHYRTRVSGEDVVASVHQLEERLGKKFRLCPPAASVRGWFPYELRHVCLEWAVQSQLDFIERFCRGTAFPPMSERSRKPAGIGANLIAVFEGA